MDFKKGNWTPGKAFELDKVSELLDNKAAKRIVDDLKLAMPPKAKQENKERKIHNPVVKASDYGKKGHPGPVKSARRIGQQDQDLMSSMMNRLTAVEKSNKLLQKEIEDRQAKIEELEKENEILKATSNSTYIAKYSELQRDREKYKKMTKDMAEFLADYGLKWVGKGRVEGEFDSDAVLKELNHKSPMYRNNLPPEIDTDVLSRKIEELNFIAEKNRIINAAGVKKLHKHDEYPIWFFKNGLVLKGCPFYPYYSKEAQSVLSDILDGYFPYDLRKNFPDGVPLKPIDKLNEVFNPNEKKKKLIKGIEDFENEPVVGISKEEFLNQFPKNVIKDGKIIPIREELEKKFKETNKLDLAKLNANEPIEVETHVVEAEKEEQKQFDKSEVVMLRIRTETGKANLILKLLATDVMKTVYEYIKPYVEDKN